MIAGGTRTGAGFVIAEIAIAVIVVVAAGLVGRSFVKLSHVPLGFTPDRLLTIRVTPKGERYDNTARVSAFYQQLLERVRNVPAWRRPERLRFGRSGAPSDTMRRLLLKDSPSRTRAVIRT